MSFIFVLTSWAGPFNINVGAHLAAHNIVTTKTLGFMFSDDVNEDGMR